MLEKLEVAEEQQRPTLTQSTTRSKRKRAESDSEDDDKAGTESFSSLKRSRLQLPTPPPSTPERATPELATPTAVQELILMHKAFIKAFSLHRAHNGVASPAELGQLLQSVTRLYQKRAVGVVDVQRMLGLMEIVPELAPRNSMEHAKSPFKLMISGLGTSRRQVVEFVGYEKQTRRNGRTVTTRISNFNEQDLQMHYESKANRVSSYKQLSGAVDAFPYLEFGMGAQTIARQNKASETKKLILDGRRPDLDFGKLSVKDEAEPEPAKRQTVKSRTLSLFDRVKAKQLANAAIDVPSAEALRRQHAIGRVAEVVEILRMKQQQKLRGMSGKTSFAFQHIVKEIQVSMNIPMGDDEIKVCLEILANEVQDGWCSIFELGLTRSIVVSGMGKSGVEIAALLKA